MESKWIFEIEKVIQMEETNFGQKALEEFKDYANEKIWKEIISKKKGKKF
jgi:hypothetical protein